MTGPFLIMVIRHSSWEIIDAWVTETLALASVERHKSEAARKMGFTGSAGGWRPGHPSYMGFGSGFPGRCLKLWSANYVGGLSGNHWSYISVVELEVQGTALNQIVEATS